MRLLILILILVSLVLVPFLIWGEFFTEMFSGEGANQRLRSFARWAWLAAILLLVSDLVLPLPATLIIAATGYLYGAFWGGLISLVGSVFAGMLGYWTCYFVGERPARWILGPSYAKNRTVFARFGGWVVVLSRWLPVFPEVVSCLAGLHKMPVLRFHLALVAGSLPMAFVFAFIGYSGQQNPGLALILSAVLPPLIWALISPRFSRERKKHA